MSITSCPNCSNQVSVPQGVDAMARCRCPLCGGEFALAEVTVDTPPELELIEAGTESVPGEWLQAPGEPDLGDETDPLLEEATPLEASFDDREPLAEGLSDDEEEELSFAEEPDPAAPISELEPLGELDEGLDFEDEPAPAAEIKHDDMLMEDKDTEIEHADFITSDPVARAPSNSDDWEPIELASADEETMRQMRQVEADADKLPPDMDASEEELELDFGPAEGSDEPAAEAPLAGDDATIDFSEPAAETGFGGETLDGETLDGETLGDEIAADGELAADSELAAEGEMGIEFEEAASDESTPNYGATVEFDASEPLSAESANEDMELDFGEPQSDDMFGSESSTIEFQPHMPGEHVVAPSAGGEGDDLELDFGEPLASESVPAQAEEPLDEGGGKKKKKKEKKKKAAEDGDEPAPRRSLVGTLVSVLLGALVALPLTVYGMLWLGPNYDFFSVGPMLAGWSVPLPAAFTKSPRGAVAYAPPSTPPAQPQGAATPPADNPPPEEPAESTPATPPADSLAAPAAHMPADSEAAPEAPPETVSESPEKSDTPDSLAETPAEAPPAVPSLEEPPIAEPPTEAMPAEGLASDEQPPKAEAPDEPSSTVPDLAATPADSTEAPGGATPADDEPLADKPLAGAPDEPFAEKPLADAPEEMPADEDPLGLDAAAPSEPRMAAKPSDDSLPLDDPSKPGDTDLPFELPGDKPELGDVAPPSEVEIEGPADAPQYSLADLGQAMETAGAADKKWTAAQKSNDQAAMKRARMDFYLSMFRLAEVLTFTEDDAQGQLANERESIERVMEQFAQDKKRLDALKVNSALWLGFARRTTPGIVVAGEVQSVTPAGKLIEVKLNVDTHEITVVQPASATELSVGDSALVLGSIVEQPDERLIGYMGDEPTVVWSGLTMMLPVQN